MNCPLTIEQAVSRGLTKSVDHMVDKTPQKENTPQQQSTPPIRPLSRSPGEGSRQMRTNLCAGYLTLHDVEPYTLVLSRSATNLLDHLCNFDARFRQADHEQFLNQFFLSL